MKNLLLLMFCCGMTVMLSAQNEGWSLAKEKNGVQVFTRFVEGYPVKEFKGVVQIKTDLNSVINTVRDADKHKDWMHNTSASRLVKKIKDDVILTYSVNDAPWPVSDRDNVIKITFQRKSPNVVVGLMKAITGYVPEKSGKVRVKKLEGYWEFKDLGNGYIEVTQQVLADPGGAIPSWLANSSIIDAPYNTLLGLKKYLEK